MSDPTNQTSYDPASFWGAIRDQGEHQEKVDSLRQSVSFAATQDPESYAKLLRQSAVTGVAPAIAKDYQDDLKPAEVMNMFDFNRFVASSPRAAEWAADPNNAAVAGTDELHRLSRIEQHAATMGAWTPSLWDKTKQIVSNVTEALTGSTPERIKTRFWEYPLTRGTAEAIGGAAGMVGDIGSFFGWHGDGKRNLLQRIETGLSAETNLDPDNINAKPTEFDWLAKNVAPMLPAVLATGGVGLVARTLGISTKAARVLSGLTVGAMFTAQQGGKTYSDLVASGVDEATARAMANRTAAITAPANALFGATDLVPVLRNNPFLTSLGLGGVTGASGQLASNVVSNQPWSKDIAASAVQGAAMQGGMHIGFGFFDGFDGVAREMRDSKLKQIAPEVNYEALKKQFDGQESLLIPADQFKVYFQSKGIDPQAIASELNVKNYGEAAVSDGMVEVPKADFFAKLDQEHIEGLAQDVVDPSTGLSRRQEQEGNDELAQWVASGGAEKLQQETAAADAELQSSPEWKQVKSELQQRYMDAGESESVADSTATLQANVYANLARETGLKPTELMAMYSPKVKVGEMDGERVLYQSPIENAVDGREADLLLPTGKMAAKYRLVEAKDLIPSHDPMTFAVNPNYPEGVQERLYDKSKEAQARVIDQAQNYEPAYTINSNPDAVNGPPVITPDGTVLGGNSRSMSTVRLYRSGKGETYKSALRQAAETYGFKAEDVDRMQEPVLVRQVESPANRDAMRRLGTDLNRSMTGALGAAEKAVSAGKNIKPETLRSVSDLLQAQDLTLRELMAAHGPKLVQMMLSDGVITDRERPQYIDTATGGLNDAGKAFVEKALLGSVIDDPRLMESAPKATLGKLERSLGAISSFAYRSDEWNILPAIRNAVGELGAIQRAESTVDLWIGQTSLFGEERNPLVDVLVRALDKKPTEVKEAFDAFSRDADANLPGQSRMFGSADAFDAFNYAFGSKLSAQEYHNGLEAAASKSSDVVEDAQSDGNLPEAPPASEGAGSQEPARVNAEVTPAPAGARGWFRILPDGSFEIGKTKIGDLSTFVHEPAHSYLEMLSRLTKNEGASDTLKADHQKILDFLGAKDGEALTAEQNEKWARANEQYLREGKAPSQSLKSVFQRFAVWLSNIYKQASDLRVELTDDIRGVFDRLYAAEEGVNRAEQEAGPQQFKSPEEAGWTEEQFQKYSEDNQVSIDQAKAEILSKLNEAALRDKTEWWRAEESNVRQAVTEQVDAKPEYKAIRALRSGTLENGVDIAMNREELAKIIGEDRLKELQKKHPAMYRNEGGLHPDVAAEMLGFRSADEMVRKLADTPRRATAIDEATRAYMTEKHGDIRYDGTLQDQARIALENDKKSERLYQELKAFQKRYEDLKGKVADRNAAMRGIEIAPIAAYRKAAQQMILAKSATDLQPTRYLDASRKASREAFEAAARGDAESAVQAKHKELINHFLFREATKEREFVGKVEGIAAKIASPKRQSAIGHAGQDFLAQIQSLLIKYRFVNGFKGSAVAEPETLGQFLQRLHDEQQLDLPIPQSVIEGASKSYKSISIGELHEVHAALVTLDHVARNINKITIEGKKVDEATVAAGLDRALVNNVRRGERYAGKRETDDANDFLRRMGDSVGHADIPILRPEFLFKRLDGMKDFGEWHDAFWNKYNDASDHLNRLRQSIFPQMLELVRGDWAKDLTKKIYIESIDATITKDDAFSILLNCGNESNLDKLERGGLRFKTDDTSIPLTEPVRQEILSHLTAEDIDKANQVLRMIGTLKPEAEKLAIKRNGIAPQWIETQEYKTQNGTLEGGYYPVVFDPRWSSAGEKQADAVAVDQMFNKYASATTRQGYMKERTKFAAPLSLDWQAVVMRHLDNVMLDISHWEFVTEAQRLLKNPAVKESIISNMGEAHHKNLMDWVRYTVNQDSIGREATDGIDKFRRTVRGNIGTAVLGFRVMNSVVETAITPLLAFQQAAPEMVFKGTAAFLRNPVGAMRFAENASDYMKNLNVEYDRQITEMWNDIRGRNTLLSDIKKWAILSRVGIWKIGATMAWHIGFLDAQRQGLDGRAAVRVADALNRKIQEAGRPGDLSAVERNPYMKELTMFIGPTLIQFNNFMEAAHAIGDKGFSAQTATKALTVLLAGQLVNTVMFDMLRGKAPDDKEKWPAWMLARLTLGVFDGVPIINQGTGYAEGKILGESGKEPRLVPVLQAMKDSVDSIDQTLGAISGKTKPERALKTVGRTVGEWTGLPSTQGIITGEFLYDLLTGAYTPDHPWSFVTDPFFARHKKD